NHQQAQTSCRGQSNISLNSYSQAKTTEKMKFQSILVFLIASLAAGTYAAPAQTCEI
ncbi:5749_t:CDS:1, partial [Paraglomus brasilianum]